MKKGYTSGMLSSPKSLDNFPSFYLSSRRVCVSLIFFFMRVASGVNREENNGHREKEGGNCRGKEDLYTESVRTRAMGSNVTYDSFIGVYSMCIGEIDAFAEKRVQTWNYHE